LRLRHCASAGALLALAATAAASGATVSPRLSARASGDYRVVHWTTAQGLPQNTVTDLAILPGGELWLATFGGLARFDGHGFRVIDMASDEGLPANRIVSLAAAGSDSFLFLTQQGHLGRVEAGRSALLVPPPTGSLEALELLVTRAGRAYCKSADGRVWQSDGRGTWQPVPGPVGAGHFHDFALDESGEAWGIWGDRLTRMASATRDAGLALPAGEPILSARGGGGLWVGLRQGLARLLDGRLETLAVRPALEGRATAIESAGEDALWVGTPGDVSLVERQPDGSWHRASLPLGLARDMSIRSLRLDGEGSLWIGTSGGGLYRANRMPTRRFGTESGLRDVAALASDGAGGAFVASGCGALFHIAASGAATSVRLPDPIGTSRLPPCGLSLAPGSGDSAWVRVGPSLFRVERAGVGAQRVKAALPFDEGPIVSNADGSLWVASRGGSLHLVTPEGSRTRELRLPAPLMSASLGPDGALWLGGDGEVFRVSAGATSRFGREEGVPRGLVRDVEAEPDGTVWIGTYGGGVGRLRAGRVARLTVRQGLPDNSVSDILDDGRGRLWISTNRGVAVVEKSEVEAVAAGRVRALSPVVLGAERGVPEANFGSPAGFADDRGRLWFGTIDGAVRLDAAAFPFNTTPPAVRIETVRADDRRLPLGPTVRIPPLTTRVRVAFTAFAPLYPERMRFRFRVEGIDADWIDAGAERTVDWSPDGPGRHRFVVEARNEDGIWSVSPAWVDLDVQPAWWQTTAFRLAVGLSLALAVVAGVRLRIRAIEGRHAERLRALEERRQAEERLIGLRAQLEHVSRAALAGELAASLAHEVRQPIGAMVNNAEAGRRHLAQYLERPDELAQIFGDIVADGMRVSEVVRGLREFLRPAGAEAAAVDLSALVREMLPLVRRELEDNRVAVSLELADGLPAVEGFRVQLGQIVVNLVVNACEALAANDGERRVAIATAEREGRVELSVCDNGPGLAASVATRLFEPFVTTKPDGLGVGLAICRSIAERHGGRLSAVSPPGGGLCMILALPAARRAAPSP
jgi:signal transduction histidine kinase/ligand-binding sensor domain-containing protein